MIFVFLIGFILNWENKYFGIVYKEIDSVWGELFYGKNINMININYIWVCIKVFINIYLSKMLELYV